MTKVEITIEEIGANNVDINAVCLDLQSQTQLETSVRHAVMAHINKLLIEAKFDDEEEGD